MHQPRIKVMIQRITFVRGNFNAKVWREDIFKPTFRNESLHEISIDAGVRFVKWATSKNAVVRV